MTDARCDQLDEYLCGWLSPDEAAEFDANWAVCPACQDQCAVQRHIDRMLAEAAVQLEPVPAVVADRIERGVRAAQRQRLVGWACAATAAAGIVLALGLWGIQAALFPKNDARPMAQGPAVAIQTTDPVVPPVSPDPQAIAVRVTLVDPSSAILVPIESHSANVTVVCVYPTTKVAHEDAKHPSP